MDDEIKVAAIRPRGARIWWWIVAAFALQIAVWTAWLIIASKQKVEEVPLAGTSQRSPGE